MKIPSIGRLALLLALPTGSGLFLFTYCNRERDVVGSGPADRTTMVGVEGVGSSVKSGSRAENPNMRAAGREGSRPPRDKRLENEGQVLAMLGDGADVGTRIADLEQRCDPKVFHTGLGMFTAKVHATSSEMLPLDTYLQIQNETIRKDYIRWISKDAVGKDFDAFVSWVSTASPYSYIAAESGLHALISLKDSGRLHLSADELERGFEVMANSLKGGDGKLKAMWATDAARFLESAGCEPERIDAWVHRIGLKNEDEK